MIVPRVDVDCCALATTDLAPERAAGLLQASDALLVWLAPDRVLETFVPAKLFGCCALGRPVVLAADGESQRLAGAAGAALPVAAGDAAALAGAVRRLRDDPPLGDRLATAGHAFAAEHMRDSRLARLEAILEAVV